MSEVPPSDPTSAETSTSKSAAESRSPADLPPVAPPSAGFIVQLFVVPALIVAAIVGVWALFGRMATSRQDLTQVVSDLKTNNPHRRWRAASNLAQMLAADAQLGDKGQQLHRNPVMAGELATLLSDQIASQTRDSRVLKEELKQQSFLTGALGWFDLPDKVLPVLQKVASRNPGPSGSDDETKEMYELQQEVRRTAVTSIAMVAGRAAEQGTPVEDAGLVADLVAVSSDPDPTLRQLSAFALGLLPDEDAQRRLRALLADANAEARLNAAIALARQQDPAGVKVLRDALASAGPLDVDQMPGETPVERQRMLKARETEQLIAVRNSLKAIEELAEEIPAGEKPGLVAAIQPIATEFPVLSVRHTAGELLKTLRAE